MSILAIFGLLSIAKEYFLNIRTAEEAKILVEQAKYQVEIIASDYNPEDYENKFYYNQLSSKEQEIYKAFYNSSLNHSNTVYIDIYEPVNLYEIHRVKDAFVSEFPQYYWWSNNYEAYAYNSFTCIDADVDEIETTLKQIEEKGDEIINNCKTNSNYQTLRNLYMHFLDNVEYDVDSKYNQDIRSALLYNSSVCAGISKAFAYLAQRLGYNCVYVTGEYDREHHAWNLIEINDDWYWLDATTRKSIYRGEYYDFLAPDSAFLTHKTFAYNFIYPKCESYDMYFNCGCVKYVFTDEDLFTELEMIANAIKVNGGDVVCLFKSNFKYKELTNNLENSDDMLLMLGRSININAFEDYNVIIIEPIDD